MPNQLKCSSCYNLFLVFPAGFFDLSIYLFISKKKFIFDAADFGVPQRRKGVFIVGVRNDLSISPDQIYEKINENTNYLVNIIKWFSIIVVISAVINFIQESFGISTIPPEYTNDLTLFLAI